MGRASLEVARVGEADLDDVLTLWAQARSEVTELTPGALRGCVPEEVRPHLAAAVGDPHTTLLLARLDHEPAGFAIVRTAPLGVLLDGEGLHLDYLHVAPALRRRGVARALLHSICGIAETSGAHQVVASAAPASRELHRFLARLGFASVVVRRVATTSTVRRRLSAAAPHPRLESLLGRRRSLRARYPGVPVK